jgi:type I restriction enzyme, S subunit
VALRDLLVERREAVVLNGGLGDWQAITIKFSGEVLPRDREDAFKGAMFAAYPGDLVFSKIDARNGAIGLIPKTITKAVVTSEYPVFIPNADRLRPLYLRHLLRASHFLADLQRRASGTSGRKRVTPGSFLSLNVPVPSLTEQDALLSDYRNSLGLASQLSNEADSVELAGWQAFETALGVTPPPPAPEQPVFVANFKDIDRWSHESIFRSATKEKKENTVWNTIQLGEVLTEVRHGCSLGPSRRPTGLRVLKISAVTKGCLDLGEHKYIRDKQELRDQFSLRAGDVLMCRTNGTLAYVGMSALVEEDVNDMIFPDKVIRVRPQRASIDPTFLWLLLQLPALRTQIENAARTAVGNYAIGGKDIKALRVPLPPIAEQQAQAGALNNAIHAALERRLEARQLRSAAWKSFKSALFEVPESVAD